MVVVVVVRGAARRCCCKGVRSRWRPTRQAEAVVSLAELESESELASESELEESVVREALEVVQEWAAVAVRTHLRSPRLMESKCHCPSATRTTSSTSNLARSVHFWRRTLGVDERVVRWLVCAAALWPSALARRSFRPKLAVALVELEEATVAATAPCSAHRRRRAHLPLAAPTLRSPPPSAARLWRTFARSVWVQRTLPAGWWLA